MYFYEVSMEDQSKFFNVIIDRTNQKLNSFQAQVIVLESQLQMANDERDMYKKYVDELPALNFNIEEHNKLKSNYTLLEARVQTVLEEQEKRHQEVLNGLNIQLQEALNANYDHIEKIKILQSNNSNDTRFIRDQNETLLQEIKRLKAEMAGMSNK